MDIQVSLCASAFRTKDWERFYNSLKTNKINYEVIFVGPNKPDRNFGENFHYIYATVKPCQCYQIAMNHAKGELVGWTADDAVYNGIGQNNLDVLYDYYKKFNDNKVIVAQRPIEDGRDIWMRHHFFGDWPNTPRMAPLGFMNRELLKQIGGYDRNFVSAQSENDIVMRVIEVGGRVELCMESYVHIYHRQSHEVNLSSGVRQYYVTDREFLENCWVVGGYGAYGQYGKQLRQNIQISKTRLRPIESFEEREDWLTISQGAKGKWS